MTKKDLINSCTQKGLEQGLQQGIEQKNNEILIKISKNKIMVI